jgi:hypothetical protein
MALLPIREARLRAADLAGHPPLWEAAVEAHAAEVLAQGVRALGVARRSRLPSSEGYAAGWQLMNESLGVRGPFVIRLRGRIPHPAGYLESPLTLADHLTGFKITRVEPVLLM